MPARKTISKRNTEIRILHSYMRHVLQYTAGHVMRYISTNYHISEGYVYSILTEPGDLYPLTYTETSMALRHYITRDAFESRAPRVVQ